MPRILVVTNPRSRRNRRDRRLAADLARLVDGYGRVVAPDSPEGLRAELAAARADGVDIVAVNGGDGTTHVVLTQMVAVWGAELPMVALLCGGTMNTVARGVGVRGRTRVILGRLMERLRRGEELPLVERRLLAVNGEQFGFLFGNGLFANFLAVYYEGAEATPLKAAWILLRGVLSALVGGPLIRRILKPVRLQVQVDGVWDAPREHLAVGAGTVDGVGLHFRPFYEALRQPGQMHVLGLACGALALVSQLPRIWLARPTNHPDIRSWTTTRFVLRSDRPITYMIDGDFHAGAPELEVAVGPQLRLLV